MNTDELVITIYDYDFEMNWKIVDIPAKLRLKYGLENGNWKNTALSKYFDEYALSRGPVTGLPNIIDFTVTQLMTSGIRSSDISTLSLWLSNKHRFSQTYLN